MTVGFTTIDEGEKALVYDLQGRARIVEGPQRIFLWREKITFLTSHRANQNEYLQIKKIDGQVQHQQGPVTMFLNPLVHHSIHVKSGVSLDANEVLVVYKQNPETLKVERYLKHGPAVFVPKANEWLHKFSWHGTDPNNKTRMIPAQSKFTTLRVIPDQFYYNVDEVRTADDALIRVKLMMFYELTDIELMLASTQDPMGDFVNCLTADIIAFASERTYLEFIEGCGDLNELKHYPQLLQRCKMIGYEVSKVVFRGYHAIETLQKMHDNAISARTKLKIAYETAEQEQALVDMKLKNELDRIVLEQKLEVEQLDHQQKMESAQQEHKLKLDKQHNTEKIKLMKKDEKAKIAAKNESNNQMIQHYSQLCEMGVSLTPYLISKNPKPEKITRVIASEGATNFHLHHS